MDKGKKIPNVFNWDLVDPSSEFQKTICDTVAQEFSKIEEVVYVLYYRETEYPGTLNFEIAVNMPRYNSGLIHNLISEIEIPKIRYKFESIVFQFHYPHWSNILDEKERKYIKNMSGVIYLKE